MRISNSVFIVFLLVFSIVWCHAENTPEGRQKELRDSLCHELKNSADDLGKQMDLCQALALSHYNMPEEGIYLNRVLDMALENDSISRFYKTITSLGYYYCRQEELKGLTRTLHLVDSVAKAHGDTTNAFFDVRENICRFYLVRGEYEVAANEIVSLLRQVEDVGYRKGIIACNENMGLLYLLIGRNKEAIAPLEKSLSLLRENDDEIMYEIQIVSYLSFCYLRMKELDRMKVLLDRYLDLLGNKPPEDQGQPLMVMMERASFCFLYSNYVNYYVAVRDKEKAKAMVDKATEYMGEGYDPAYSSVYHLAMACYSRLMEDYPKAIYYIDKTLEDDYAVEPLEEKIDILRAAGHLDEAQKVYDELLDFIGKRNVMAYTRQINQLHAFHDMSEQERQERLLQERQLKIEHKKSLVIFFFIFVCLLSLSVISLVYYAYRKRRLKSALEEERQSLKAASEYLLLAKEKAEKADYLKTIFVANVSHEIRTPLNAIVGFSTLLNEVEEDEQAGFIELVHTNTELLLKLLNDVLDLSDMEADDFRLDVRDADLHEVCVGLREAIRHKLAAGVSFSFTHPVEPVIVRTDVSCVRQLLMNLLLNAAKYTEKGEVNLDYKIDAEKNKVVFSVTDTGCGIPLEKQEVVFDRFVKIDDFQQGAGLGLSVCRAIAARLGGWCFIDGSYRQGARFIFEMSLVGSVLDEV